MKQTAKCKTCEHGILDERWGEYKCKKQLHRINSNARVSCRSYKRRTTPIEVKETDDD